MKIWLFQKLFENIWAGLFILFYLYSTLGAGGHEL